MNISDEAVAVARRSLEREFPYDENNEYIVRLVLDAAAPHIMAQAWDEGAEAMCDEGVPECDYARNPYRSVATQ